MSDLFFFFSILLFLFVVWVYTGGPMHPISFSGPYITPITNVGSIQEGYGDKISGTISAGGFSVGVGEPSANATRPVVADVARSPYAGKVRITSADPRATNAHEENVIIHSDSDSSFVLTGWQLVGANSGTHVRIPEGSRHIGGHGVSIKLLEGDDAIITSGTRVKDDDTYERDDTWYVYLGNRRDIWDDKRDTITLLDANGKVVDQYSY